MKESQLRQKSMKKDGQRKSRLLEKATEHKKFARKVDAKLRAMCGRQSRG